MDTQRQDYTGKKPLSGASKRPDAFWGLIVPSACLEKGRLDPTMGADPAHPRINHAEELKGSQPAVREGKGTPQAISRADATNLLPHLGVTPKNKNPVERKAKGRPEPTARAQLAHPYISLAEQLDCTRPVESDEHAHDGGLFEVQVLASTPALHKADKGEEPSGLDDTDGSNGDEDYFEDEIEDGSENASDASSPATRISQVPDVIPRRASAKARENWGECLKEPSKATAPNRKMVPSQPASAKGRRPRKRVRTVVEISGEESGAESDEESDEKYTANRRVPRNVTRVARGRGQGQSFPVMKALPPLSRQHQPWTRKEEQTLFSLRNQGKSWKYIGERILGRTISGVKGHWNCMRTESLQPVEARAKGRRRRQKSSVVSAMARTPRKNSSWTEKEEKILTSLRARGKTLRYICRRIPGRKYGACKMQWRKIKDQYPQAVTTPKIIESNGKEDPWNRQDAYSSYASQLVQEAKEVESNSRLAVVEREDSKPDTAVGSLTVVDGDTLSVYQSYQRARKFRLDPTGPGSNAASADQHHQQDLQPATRDEDPSSNPDHSEHQDQPNTQPVMTQKNDPETKKAWSIQEDRLLISLRKEGRDWIYIAIHILGHTTIDCEERYETMRQLWGSKEP
ncbi:MAG: hypothetical protein ALECFALPRED_008677 [Alectoria fallacina]|uniref:Myb-like domain-containing protein n=1 Tax=Alectoria fallacina TaxID=1903189 RepID=A0A8H3J477_9LECA|nr:MAG: hypothetical protein ALECFALPRED_008677 [Alectoria fallacina]